MDSIRWRPASLVQKFDRDQVAWVRGKTGLLEPDCDTLLRYVKPYEELYNEGNLLTTAGLDRITKRITGVTATALDATNSRLGVGDSSTAAAVGDTSLTGTTNSYFRLPDATYPTQSNGVLTWKASFADTEANFAWNCWGVDGGIANGQAATAPLVNRKVQSMGTKSSGTWALTVTITLS